MAITHSTIATKADEAGAEVNKDEWNDDHVLGGAALEPTTDSTTSLGSSSKRFTTGFVDAMAGFAMEATLDMGGFAIDNLATPTADDHGANKGYVDSLAGGTTHDIFSATHTDTSGSVATSDVMQYDGTNWLARTLTEAGIAAASHTHTSDEVTDYSGVHTSDDITDYSGQHEKADITDFAHDLISASHGDTSGTVATSDVFQYDGSFWIPRTLAEAGIAAASHTHTSDEITDYSGVHTSDEITDYSGQHTKSDITDFAHDMISASHGDTSGTVATNDVFQYDGSFWIPRTLTEAGIAAASHTHTSDEVTDYSGVHTSDDITDYSGVHTKSDISDFAHDLVSSSHSDTSPSVAPVTDDVLQWTGTEWLATGITAAAAAHDILSSSHGDTSPSIAPATYDILTYSGSEWIPGGSRLQPLILPCSDEKSTALSATSAVFTFRMPFAMTLTDVRASLQTASTSGKIYVDINESASSILSTVLSIDQDEKTSETAATAAVISDSSLADDAEITIDIDGAGTGAKGLKVTLVGYRT